MPTGLKLCLLIVLGTLCPHRLYAASDDDAIRVGVPVEGMPVLEADRLIPIGELGYVKALSGDGKTVYILDDDVATLDLRWLIHECIVEITAGLAGLALLILLWRAWRSVRKKRIAGETYCRKCNYHLRGCTADACPECGVKFTARIRFVMPTRRRRCLRFAIWLLILALPVALVVKFKAELQDSIYHLRWHSPTLARWVNNLDIEWLKNDYVTSTYAIRGFDLETEQMLFEMVFFPDIFVTDCVVASQGDVLIVHEEDFNAERTSFECFDSRTGEHRHTVWSHVMNPDDLDRPDLWGESLNLISVSSDGRSLFILRGQKLKRVDTTTGEMNVVVENAGFIPQEGARRSIYPSLAEAHTYVCNDLLLYLDGYDLERVIKEQAIHEVRLRVTDLQTDTLIVDTKFRDDGWRMAALSPDGRSLWAFEPGYSDEVDPATNERWIEENTHFRRHSLVDGSTGKAIRVVSNVPSVFSEDEKGKLLVGEFESPHGNAIHIDHMPFGMKVSPDGRWLFISVSTGQGYLLIWDIENERVHAQLNTYEPLHSDYFHISRDGKRLNLLVVHRPKGANTPGDMVVAVYDLEKILREK